MVCPTRLPYRFKPRPDVVLTVASDGSDREELEYMTTEFGLNENVESVGYQSQVEVRKQMKQTDVFVMSSFVEGIFVVLMEAIAADLLVVALQIAGLSEL